MNATSAMQAKFCWWSLLPSGNVYQNGFSCIKVEVRTEGDNNDFQFRKPFKTITIKLSSPHLNYNSRNEFQNKLIVVENSR